MTAFAPIRALGRTLNFVAAPPPEPPATDSVVAALTARLLAAGAWRWGATMDVERGRHLAVRVFLPEIQQSDRSSGAPEAAALRQLLNEALDLEGYVVRFSDALWRDSGRRGWSVLARANPRA